jgi:hypothetical protein
MGRDDRYLYMGLGNPILRVCFVGSYQEIYCYYDELPSGKIGFKYSTDDGLKDEYKGFSKRIISFVVDRMDGNKLKLYICPVSVWHQIEEYRLKNHISGNENFEIERSGRGLQTRYHVKFVNESRVTSNQRDIVEATSNTYSFNDILIKKVEWDFLSVYEEPIESRFEILDL